MTVSAIECSKSVTVTGEYWSRENPPYSFRYFKFQPATGGGIGFIEASLSCEFSTSKACALLESILEIRKSYPFISLGVGRAEPNGMSLSIIERMYFDFNCLFALEVEEEMLALEREGDLSKTCEVIDWGKKEYYRPTTKSTHVPLQREKGMGWSHSNANEAGLEEQRITLDMHHKGSPDEDAFFKELCRLLDACNIEFLSYKVLSQNYMLYFGNGRLGVSGAPVRGSNVVKFEIEVLALVKQYGFEFRRDPKWSGFEVGLDNFFKLVATDSIVVKDERS